MISNVKNTTTDSVLLKNTKYRNSYLTKNRKYSQWHYLMTPAIGTVYSVPSLGEETHEEITNGKSLSEYTYDHKSDLSTKVLSRYFNYEKPEKQYSVEYNPIVYDKFYHHFDEHVDYLDFISSIFDNKPYTFQFVEGLLSTVDIEYAMRSVETGVVKHINVVNALGGAVTTNEFSENETRLGYITNQMYSSSLMYGANFSSLRDRMTGNWKYITPSLFKEYGNNLTTVQKLSDLLRVDPDTGFLRSDLSYGSKIAHNVDDVTTDNNGYYDNVVNQFNEDYQRMVLNISDDDRLIYLPSKKENKTYINDVRINGVFVPVDYSDNYNVDEKYKVTFNGRDYLMKMDTPANSKRVKLVYNEGDNEGENPEEINTEKNEQETNFYDEDEFGTNNLLRKTNNLFNKHKISTLIGRFHSDDSGDRSSFIDSARDERFNNSHGRNLLKLDARTKDYMTNGYENPYCRVWTYHHQYDNLNKRIRPFIDTDNNGKERFMTIEETQKMNSPFRANLGTKDVSGGKYLAQNTVLNDNGFLKIAPSTESENGKTNIQNYMLSIENLAWKDFTKDLTKEQIGPNGGRIMWFPPYDLTFDENIKADWDSKKFIGRGEPIYTYTDTSRNGNLKFTMLIDHPSVVNRLKSYTGKGAEQDVDADILRYFAGCDILDPDNGADNDGINLDDQDVPFGDDLNTNGNKIIFPVFFPNNYSGFMQSGNTWGNNKQSKPSEQEFIGELKDFKSDNDWWTYLLMGSDTVINEEFSQNGENGNVDLPKKVDKITADITFYNDALFSSKNEIIIIIESNVNSNCVLIDDIVNVIKGSENYSEIERRYEGTTLEKHLEKLLKSNIETYVDLGITTRTYTTKENSIKFTYVYTYDSKDDEGENLIKKAYESSDVFSINLNDKINKAVINYNLKNIINATAVTSNDFIDSVVRGLDGKNFIVTDQLKKDIIDLYEKQENKSGIVDLGYKINQNITKNGEENTDETHLYFRTVDISEEKFSFNVGSLINGRDNKNALVTSYIPVNKGNIVIFPKLFDMKKSHSNYIQTISYGYEIYDKNKNSIYSENSEIKFENNKEENRKIKISVDNASYIRFTVCPFTNDGVKLSFYDGGYYDEHEKILYKNDKKKTEATSDSKYFNDNKDYLKLQRYFVTKKENTDFIPVTSSTTVDGTFYTNSEGKKYIDVLIKDNEIENELGNLKKLIEESKTLDENITLNFSVFDRKWLDIYTSVASNPSLYKKSIENDKWYDAGEIPVDDDYYIRLYIEPNEKNYDLRFIFSFTSLSLNSNNFIGYETSVKSTQYTKTPTNSEGISSNKTHFILSQDNMSKFYYRVDWGLRQNMIYGHGLETLVVNGYPNGYQDVFSFGYNFDISKINEYKKYFSKCNYSFAEVFMALYKVYGRLDKRGNFEAYNVAKFNAYMDYFKSVNSEGYGKFSANVDKIVTLLNSGKVKSVVTKGGATEQDKPNQKGLATRRSNTVSLYVNEVLKKSTNNQLGRASGYTVTNDGLFTFPNDVNIGDINVSKHNNDPLMKVKRCTICEIEIENESNEQQGTDNKVNTEKVFDERFIRTSDKFKSNVLRYDNEYNFFNMLHENDPLVYKKIKDKYNYFDPAFHSMSPEGFNARLNFLHQCTRQGHTFSAADINKSGWVGATAGNLAFGRMPVCVLRIGDFINTRIIIESISISYSKDGMQWDLNPEGAGVQPMFAEVSMSFNIIGGQSLSTPINRLQNAQTFDYYANTGVYDDRADRAYINKDDSYKLTYKNLFLAEQKPTK